MVTELILASYLLQFVNFDLLLISPTTFPFNHIILFVNASEIMR